MTPTQRRILAALQQRPRTAFDFANAPHGDVRISESIAEGALQMLVFSGCARRIEGLYHCTEYGERELGATVNAAPSREFGNATTRETYRTNWSPVRQGADDHRQCKSRGIGA